MMRTASKESTTKMLVTRAFMNLAPSVVRRGLIVELREVPLKTLPKVVLVEDDMADVLHR